MGRVLGGEIVWVQGCGAMGHTPCPGGSVSQSAGQIIRMMIAVRIVMGAVIGAATGKVQSVGCAARICRARRRRPGERARR